MAEQRLGEIVSGQLLPRDIKDGNLRRARDHSHHKNTSNIQKEDE